MRTAIWFQILFKEGEHIFNYSLPKQKYIFENSHMISDIIQRRWTYFQLFIAEAERFFWEQPYDLSWGLDISPFFNRTVLSVCRNKQPKYHLRWHIEHFENSPMIYDIVLKGLTYFQLFSAEAERFFENSPMISDIIHWSYVHGSCLLRFFWLKVFE